MFHHESADDSDSDSVSVENGTTNASERTPLLASGAVLTATAASVHGMCGMFFLILLMK